MTKYYKLTQIREKVKEEIYFKVKREELTILYHNDLSQAEKSGLEEISEDEMEIVLKYERAIEEIGKIERMLRK